MMMMPFVRLIAIYAIVGAAIFAFLKRDEIMAYMNPPEDPAFANPIAIPFAQPAEAEDTAPETEAAPVSTAEAEQPVESTSPAPAAETPETTYSAPPAFGTQITPQYFGQAAAPAAASATTSEDTMVSRWTKAREVFSQGKPEEAATLYEALTADFPDNADLHGETGNLYYNLGQFGKAAAHYQAVGEIAGRAGDRQMAGNMLALLQRIAPAKAAELQATLTGR